MLDVRDKSLLLKILLFIHLHFENNKIQQVTSLFYIKLHLYTSFETFIQYVSQYKLTNCKVLGICDCLLSAHGLHHC